VHVFYGSYSHEVDWYAVIHCMIQLTGITIACMGYIMLSEYTTLYILTSTHSLKQQKLPLRY